MDKYAQLKRLHHDLRLQVDMYDFKSIDPESIPVEEYFPATKTLVENYKIISTSGPVSKHWLRFSYIHSEYYELHKNFDKIELKTIRPQIQQQSQILLQKYCVHQGRTVFWYEFN